MKPDELGRTHSFLTSLPSRGRNDSKPLVFPELTIFRISHRYQSKSIPGKPTGVAIRIHTTIPSLSHSLQTRIFSVRKQPQFRKIRPDLGFGRCKRAAAVTAFTHFITFEPGALTLHMIKDLEGDRDIDEGGECKGGEDQLRGWDAGDACFIHQMQ